MSQEQKDKKNKRRRESYHNNKKNKHQVTEAINGKIELDTQKGTDDGST
jgi:hypothetical protein